MNKRFSTLLFLIGSGIINLSVISFLVWLGVRILSLFQLEQTSPGFRSFLMILIFLAAIVSSFFVYRMYVRLIARRVDMEKHFHPIFRSRP